MFCPKCSAFLNEREIVKTNVKYAPGNVPIEYDARCPNCRVEMGHVSWGQLTVDPALERQMAKTPAAQNTGDTGGAKICPHCGKPLPKDY